MNYQSIIESILFSMGNEVKTSDIKMVLGLDEEQLSSQISLLKQKYEDENSGLELLILEDKLKLVSKSANYRYIYPFIDDNIIPKLTPANLEVLSIIAYNPKITRAQIEAVKGVNIDSSLHKLLEYNLVIQAGKSNLPGKPMTYVTTNKFLELFGLSSLDSLPELPKIDE